MLKNSFAFFVLLCVFLSATAKEKQPAVVEITYANYSNGTIENEPATRIKYANGVMALNAETDQIQAFTDFLGAENIDLINYEGKNYKLVTPFDSLPKPTFTEEKASILGYECKHAFFTSFSNKIEVWYTESAPAKGSPYKNYLPTQNALVLKVIVNGNYGLVATKIETLKKAKPPVLDSENAEEITSAQFEELRIKSRYTTLPVFVDEKINFEGDLVEETGALEGGKTYRFSNGTVILKKIKLPEMFKDGAYVYAKLTCASAGDAYDRTGSVFMLPTSTQKNSMLNALQFGVEKLPVIKDNLGNAYQGFVSDSTYDVPIEVMRFFTSFGVDFFNNRRPINNYNWADAAVYKQEITALLPENEDSVWIGVFIGNYSEGGHRVSLDLDFYPGFEKNAQTQKWLQPLFLTVNIMEMSGQNYPKLFKNDTLEVTFDVPENTENVELLFTTTGHGGWGGGDEFNPKQNQIFIDQEQVFSVVPWRTDCATYRLLNPASGNFGNGMSSSDLSRSNWCPATLTPPYLVPLNNLSAGKHTLKVVINQGEDEGGSFSHWGVSGVLVGERSE